MDLIEYGLFAFSSLFVIVDPIAAVPAFLAMTQRDSVAQRLRTARMACVVVVGFLTGFALLGQAIFKLLGITLPAGTNRRRHCVVVGRARHAPGATITVQETAEETAAGTSKDDIAITPLAVPMLAGPAAISTVILLEAQARSLMHRGILLACLVLVGLASYIILAVGATGAKWLNPIAEKIISRLMGLLLAALAIQFMLNAITSEQGILSRFTAH